MKRYTVQKINGVWTVCDNGKPMTQCESKKAAEEYAAMLNLREAAKRKVTA